MRIDHEAEVSLPRQKAWELLNDPETLVAAAPGLKSLEATGKDVYNAVVEVAVGPVRGRFKGTVKIVDKVEPERMTLDVDVTGPGGGVKATAELTLTDAGDATRIAYSADAQLSGTLAVVGGRLASHVARMQADQFFKNLAHREHGVRTEDREGEDANR